MIPEHKRWDFSHLWW